MNDTPKRKNTTSREARKRYDDAHFVKKTFSLPRDLFAEFKDKCIADKKSMSSIFCDAMRDYIHKK